MKLWTNRTDGKIEEYSRTGADRQIAYTRTVDFDNSTNAGLVTAIEADMQLPLAERHYTIGSDQKLKLDGADVTIAADSPEYDQWRNAQAAIANLETFLDTPNGSITLLIAVQAIKTLTRLVIYGVIPVVKRLRAKL